MKKVIFVFLLLASSIVHVSSQDEYGIVLKLSGVENTSLCGTNLILYADSTYIYFQGCETKGKCSIGHWGKTSTTISLRPIDTEIHNPIRSIKQEADKSNPKLQLIILDKNGKPIPNFFVTEIPSFLDARVINSPTTQAEIVISNR